MDTGFVYLDILPSWFGALAVTLFGLAIGSFLNVVIYRIPLMLEYYDSLASDSPDLAEQAGTATEAREREHISLLQPRRSFCPNCQRQITAMENIPVFSYLLLGGKCRGCQLPISWIYPFVELLTAGAFVGAFFKQLALPEFSIPWLFADLIFIALNISLIFIDYNHMILPDVLTYPGLLLAVAFRWLVPQPAYMESGFFAVQICLILLMMLAILGSLVKWGHSQRFKVALLIGLIGFIGFASYQLLHLPEWYFDFQVKFFVLWQQVFAERPATASVFNGLMGLCIGAGLLQVMRLLYFVWRGIEGMGFGDIKMMLMVGMYLGWQYTFANLVLGAFLGVGGAMIFLLYNSRKVQDVQDALQFKIPFGVFLGAAAIILTLSGEDIVGWYLRHFLAVAP